jgi:hypothetical protein
MGSPESALDPWVSRFDLFDHEFRGFTTDPFLAAGDRSPV